MSARPRGGRVTGTTSAMISSNGQPLEQTYGHSTLRAPYGNRPRNPALLHFAPLRSYSGAHRPHCQHSRSGTASALTAAARQHAPRGRWLGHIGPPMRPLVNADSAPMHELTFQLVPHRVPRYPPGAHHEGAHNRAGISRARTFGSSSSSALREPHHAVSAWLRPFRTTPSLHSLFADPPGALTRCTSSP